MTDCPEWEERQDDPLEDARCGECWFLSEVERSGGMCVCTLGDALVLCGVAHRACDAFLPAE